MVDEGLVRHKLSLLAEYIQDLREVREIAFEEFIINKRIRRYVENKSYCKNRGE